MKKSKSSLHKRRNTKRSSWNASSNGDLKFKFERVDRERGPKKQSYHGYLNILKRQEGRKSQRETQLQNDKRKVDMMLFSKRHINLLNRKPRTPRRTPSPMPEAEIEANNPPAVLPNVPEVESDVKYITIGNTQYPVQVSWVQNVVSRLNEMDIPTPNIPIDARQQQQAREKWRRIQSTTLSNFKNHFTPKPFIGNKVSLNNELRDAIRNLPV